MEGHKDVYVAGLTAVGREAERTGFFGLERRSLKGTLLVSLELPNRRR